MSDTQRDFDVHVATLTDEQINEISRAVAEVLHDNHTITPEAVERRLTRNANTIMEAVDKQTHRAQLLSSSAALRHAVTASYSQQPVLGLRTGTSGLIAEFYHQVENSDLPLNSILDNPHNGVPKKLITSTVRQYFLIKHARQRPVDE